MSDTNWMGYMGLVAISLFISRPFLQEQSRFQELVRFEYHLWRQVPRIVPPISVLSIIVKTQKNKHKSKVTYQ